MKHPTASGLTVLLLAANQVNKREHLRLLASFHRLFAIRPPIFYRFLVLFISGRTHFVRLCRWPGRDDLVRLGTKCIEACRMFSLRERENARQILWPHEKP